MTFRFPLLLFGWGAVQLACYGLACWLHGDCALCEADWQMMSQTAPWVVALQSLAGILSGQYRRSLRRVTFPDAARIVLASVSATTACGLVDGMGFCSPGLPPAVLVVDCGMVILATAGIQSARRAHRELMAPLWGGSRRKRAIVYGNAKADAALLRSLRSVAHEYDIVGLVDAEGRASAATVAGVPVWPARRELADLAAQLRIDHVLIAASISGPRVRQIIQACAALGIEAKVVPSGQDPEDLPETIVRDVSITDLLKRKSARLDMNSIHRYVSGRRVLVTGAAGSIGSELCRQILELGPDRLVLVDQSESGIFHLGQDLADRPCRSAYQLRVADVTSQELVRAIMQDCRPELIFHAGAYKHVPLMEENPAAAVRNNVLGTRTVADLAHELGAQSFVLISTDKAVEPASVMGATKRIAERYVQALDETSRTDFVVVRFGNVLDSDGSVVPIFRRQIERGGPITITHPEMTRYFLTIPEAVQLVLQAGAIGRGGEILILDMGDPIPIVELAKDMIHLSGLRYPQDIDIVFTGMRPGEKLHEALFGSDESSPFKVHEKIFSVKGRVRPLAQVRADIAWLESVIRQRPAELAAILRELVAASPDEDSPILPLARKHAA